MIQLTSDNFDSFITENNFVLIDFYAEWCRPCNVLAQTLAEVENQYNGQVAFAKVDIETMSDVVQQYNIGAIPTMLVFKDGEVASRMVGLRTAEQILSNIEEVENG